MAFFSGGWSSLKAAGGRYLGAVLYNKEQNQTAAYATLLYLEDLVESRQGYLALHFAAPAYWRDAFCSIRQMVSERNVSRACCFRFMCQLSGTVNGVHGKRRTP